MKLTFESFNFPKDAMASMQEGKDFFIGARLIADVKGKKFNIEPKMNVSNGQQSYTTEQIPESDVSVRLNSLVASGTINITASKSDGSAVQSNQQPLEVLSIEASIKPFINLVWAGVLVMTIGFLISTV